MFDQPVTFVDIETSGVSASSARIIEIAALRVEGGEVVDTFQTLVNPGKRLPRFITDLTGITEAELADAPFFDDIAWRIEQICQGALFVAHNVRFDYSFVANEMTAAGRSFTPGLLCTVRLSRALYPAARGHSLARLIERHDIGVAARHRAYDDAAALWAFCQVAHREHGSEAFAAAVARQLARQTLPPHLSETDLASLKNEPGVYIFEDAEGTPIYVGKSVSLRTRVLSHFSNDARAAKEMKIAQATHHIRSIPTGDELQALLLESSLVKKYLPLYNVQLRYARRMTALTASYDSGGYLHISLQAVDMAELKETGTIWGLYDNRKKAQAALTTHREAFSLCSKLLGLEKVKAACFHYHLKRCHGACLGIESPAAYNDRAQAALERSRLEAWPFDTPITIQTKQAPETGIIVNKWRVLGIYDFVRGTADDSVRQHGFDLDAYKILRAYLRHKADQLIIKPYVYV